MVRHKHLNDGPNVCNNECLAASSEERHAMLTVLFVLIHPHPPSTLTTSTTSGFNFNNIMFWHVQGVGPEKFTEGDPLRIHRVKEQQFKPQCCE